MTESTARSRVASSAVINALEILESFDGEHARQSLAEISRRLRIPKSSAYRNLAALEALGYVVRDAGGREFSLGPKVLELAQRFLDQNSLVAVARPVLRELAAETGETAHLGVLAGQDVVYIEIAESPQRVRALVQRGDRLEAHTVASGKAILAFSSASTVEVVVARGLRRFTARTISTREDLLEQLAATRRRGFAIMSGEWVDEVAAVSAPIFGPGCEVVAAAGIAAPRARLEAEDLERVGAVVRRFADQISSGLGGRPPAIPSHPILPVEEEA